MDQREIENLVLLGVKDLIADYVQNATMYVDQLSMQMDQLDLTQRDVIKFVLTSICLSAVLLEARNASPMLQRALERVNANLTNIAMQLNEEGTWDRSDRSGLN